MTQATKTLYTVEEYFAQEEAAEFKKVKISLSRTCVLF
jgi:hypothetical protein